MLAPLYTVYRLVTTLYTDWFKYGPVKQLILNYNKRKELKEDESPTTLAKVSHRKTTVAVFLVLISMILLTYLLTHIH